MRGCSTNVEKMCEISRMFLRRYLNACALSETKLNRKGEVVGVGGGPGVREKEGVSLLLRSGCCAM